MKHCAMDEIIVIVEVWIKVIIVRKLLIIHEQSPHWGERGWTASNPS
jgi:hypothetical protein